MALPTHPLRCGGVHGRPRRRRLSAAVRRLRQDQRRAALRRPRCGDRRRPAPRRAVARGAAAAASPGAAVRVGALVVARRPDGAARPVLSQPPAASRSRRARQRWRRSTPSGRSARSVRSSSPSCCRHGRPRPTRSGAAPCCCRRSAAIGDGGRRPRASRRRHERRSQPADPALRLRLRPRWSAPIGLRRDDHLRDARRRAGSRGAPTDRRRHRSRHRSDRRRRPGAGAMAGGVRVARPGRTLRAPPCGDRHRQRSRCRRTPRRCCRFDRRPRAPSRCGGAPGRDDELGRSTTSRPTRAGSSSPPSIRQPTTATSAG